VAAYRHPAVCDGHFFKRKTRGQLAALVVHAYAMGISIYPFGMKYPTPFLCAVP
jgi:hypothetical protein